MPKTILVGFGFSAQTFHLPFLTKLEDFTITGVVSSRPEDVHASLPDVTVYPTLDEALTSDATLFVITTPSHLHNEMIRQCLAKDKDVLVEKPAFLTKEEGEALREAEASSKGMVNVYQNRRFDGDFLTVQALLSSRAVGNWKVLESRFDRFRPHIRDRWRENSGPGAGILFDLGSHLIDQALVLFGPPTAVQADVIVQRDGGQTDDGFTISLHYDEKRVVLRSNPFIAAEFPRFELHGTEGSFVKFGLDPQEEALKGGQLTSDTLETGILTRDRAESIAIEKGSYLTFYEALAASFVSRQAVVSIDDALLTTTVMEVARESSETGRTIPFPN